jgi:DNA-binding NarL/FixJ family response regulator
VTGLPNEVVLIRDFVNTAEPQVAGDEWTTPEAAQEWLSAHGLLAGADPDVMLVNVCSRRDTRALAWLRRHSPTATLVAVGVENSEWSVAACAEAGAVGYLPRDATGAELIDAVERAGRGEVVCPPSMIRTLVASAARRAPALCSTAADELTERERQVVALIADGCSNKQIAQRLHIEVTTVKSHVHSILAKLNVNRRSEAVALMQGALS